MLRAPGHVVDVAPLLHIEILPDADLGAGPWSGVVVTSANALRALAAHPRRGELMALPLFAVGTRSAAEARAVGFTDVVSADGDADDLAHLVAARGDRAHPLLWLAGEDRATDLAATLAPHGIALRTVVAYRAVAAAALPPALCAALAAGAIDGVLHYSRRTAAAFVAAAGVAMVDIKLLKLMHYCISAEVAAGLRQAGLRAVATAARPDQDSLLALLD